jgi:hypothetical protein
MNRITRSYLASKGVLFAVNGETGLLEVQRIDDPHSFALDEELHFIPPYLESDEVALDVVYNISAITLDDESISSEMREIIVEDCFDVVAFL